ncbi:MAG: hypothetical protein R3C49_16160 [Planctomycetaceae bacterium]
MQLPRGGGQRLVKDSTAYRILETWIRNGAPAAEKDAAQVTRLTVFPSERVAEPNETQQLQVVAWMSDGSNRDVTAWAKFDSTDDSVLSVTPDGFVTVEGRGQAAVMVRYQADIAMFVSPYGPIPDCPIPEESELY